MQNNLASSAAALSGIIAGIERAADGELAHAVAVAAAERGGELLAESFATLTAPSGVPWVPPARDYGHPLLHATGALESSGTCTVGPRDDASGFDLTFAYTDEKAPWQHFGTSRGGRAPSGMLRKSGKDGTPYYGASASQHIPARPLLPMTGDHARWSEDLESAGRIAAERWLTENVSV